MEKQSARPIKFRAWDPEIKMWLIPDGWGRLLTFNGQIVIPRDEGGLLPEQGYDLSQFTGLYDKNNAEIWEGDIVELSPPGYPDAMIRRVVTYDDTFGQWRLTPEITWTSRGQSRSASFIDARRGLVVSNIYEHPELQP